MGVSVTLGGGTTARSGAPAPSDPNLTSTMKSSFVQVSFPIDLKPGTNTPTTFDVTSSIKQLVASAKKRCNYFHILPLDLKSEVATIENIAQIPTVPSQLESYFRIKPNSERRGRIEYAIVAFRINSDRTFPEIKADCTKILLLSSNPSPFSHSKDYRTSHN